MYESKAWVRSFRNAAIEFRTLREQGSGEIEKKETDVSGNLSLLLVEICERGFLRGLKGLSNHIKEEVNAKGDLVFAGMYKFFLFRNLMGYDKVEYEESYCIAIYGDDEHNVATPRLMPGLISEVSPTVFKPIEGHLLIDEGIQQFKDSKYPEEWKEQQNYERLGYYAMGCELLADIIEEEAKQTVVPESKPEQSWQVQYLLADDKARQEAEILRLKSKTVAPESKPEQAGSKQNRKRGQWIGPAIAWLKRDPTLTDAAIAVKPDVNIGPSQMSRNEQWKAIRKAAAGIAQESILKGTKYDQTIDAICDETQF